MRSYQNLTDLGRLSSHHHKLLRALHQEVREFVAKNRLDFVSLLDSNTDSHAVDTGFNETFLLLVATNCHRVEKKLLT